jgi:hypothetical protein
MTGHEGKDVSRRGEPPRRAGFWEVARDKVGFVSSSDVAPAPPVRVVATAPATVVAVMKLRREIFWLMIVLPREG